MAVVEWRDDFVSGDAVIDAQHRALCKTIIELHEALAVGRSPEVTRELLVGLERYVLRHFNTERQLMESSGYPGARAHLAQHEEIERKTREMLENCQTHRMVMGVTITQFLGRRFSEHVVTEDKKMIQWSRLNGRTVASASGQFPVRDSAQREIDVKVEPRESEAQIQQARPSGNWVARDSLRQLMASNSQKPKK